MRLPKFDYLAPKEVEEAGDLLSRFGEKAMVVAGGTDLIVRLRQRVVTPRYVVSLGFLSNLDYIKPSPGGGVSIGALTRVHSLERAESLGSGLDVISLAAGKLASPQIRNAATVGGNLCLDTRCWFYNKSHYWRQSRPPCFKAHGDVCHVVKGGDRCYSLFTADLVPPLIALDASVKIRTPKGERTMNLQELYSGKGERPVNLSPGEIITEVDVPPAGPGKGTVYLKLSFRQAVDFPVVGVAASVSGKAATGICENIGIVIGAVSSGPVRASGAEAVIKGKKLTPELVEMAADAAVKDVGVIVPIGTTVEYKRKMVKYFVSQAINEAWKAVAVS
ncbi:MAG: xanthine dehydrogenase family protein subunit M [Dehalococcoidia bacterium]|nr:xanthine dehydrogenase family protein subunit M [Dehalococcoidia bacterium]MDZ4246936.1 xanthine dehydrogenase family protein subunit M [Dehalococcoidia bacterium]